MKKILSILLITAMTVSMLAACSSGTSTSTTAAAGGDSTAAAAGGDSTTAAAEETTAGAAEEALAANAEDILMDVQVINTSDTVDKIIQLEQSPANLDPTSMNDRGMTFLWEIYEMPYQLTGFGGELVPVLADASKGNYKPGMDHEDGSNEYTLYIREGIIDQAGNEIKGSDVAFSYDLLVNSGNARGMGMYESCEAIDDYSVKLTFQRELNLVGELTTFFARVFILSEDSYNASPSGFVSDACGTGPYKLKEFTSGSKMILEKNEDYWCPEDEMTCQIQVANAQEIEIVYANEVTSQVVALGTGTADVDGNLSLADVGDFQDGGTYGDQYDLYTYWDNLTYCLLPNCHEDSLTGDINMRLAIFYAADVTGITAGLAADVPGSYRECYGMGNPNFPDFSENWETWDNYETCASEDRAAKVQEYLDKAGYNGETIRILAQEGEMETIATILNGMLDMYGIKSEITLVDRTTINNIKGDPGAWEISVESWASSDFAVNMWDKLWKTTDDDGYIKESLQWIKDDDFLEMCVNSKSIEGHTQENVDKVQQAIIDNAYAMGLTQQCRIIVYPTYMKGLYLTDKNSIVIGCCAFGEK